MKLTVLGSMGGYPTPGQPCSGYLVEAGGRRLWVDTGSGTLDALLRRCDLWDLDAIWISHLHADHWSDLPIALHRMGQTRTGDPDPVPVFGPPGWVDGTGVTARWRLEDDQPVLAARELEDEAVYEVGELELQAYRTEHSVECYGVRIRYGSQVLAYSADSAACDAMKRLGREADLCLFEAGATSESSPVHMTAGQAAELASAAGARRLVLTHLMPGRDPEPARQQAQASFDGPVDVATPGDEMETS